MNKYLTIFGSHSQYVEPEVKPNVSYCKLENEVHYNPYVHDYSQDYLTTKALENGTISFNIRQSIGTDTIASISYSTDDSTTWTTVANQNDKLDLLIITVNVEKGDKILWKGQASAMTFVDNSQPEERFLNAFFSSTALFDVEGNIMSLCYGDNFIGEKTLKKIALFYGLFGDPISDCNCLVVNAKNLSLPATTLTESCYDSMFYACYNLITAPSILPAMTLAKECYGFMFLYCRNLTVAPKLPALQLAYDCYRDMFNSCESLINAPELPALQLVENCYESMFYGCTSLVTAPKLPATTLVDKCYIHMFQACTNLINAPELPATTLANSCYYEMFYGCTNLSIGPQLPALQLKEKCYWGMFELTGLIVTPIMSATVLAKECCRSMFTRCEELVSATLPLITTLADNCYSFMFYGCTNLTTPPELPATTLAVGCYNSMFLSCTSLTTAPVLHATTLVQDCYSSMFSYCSSLTSITCLATDISADDCTNLWTLGIALRGIFTKSPSMNNWTTGKNGIPNNWEKLNYIPEATLRIWIDTFPDDISYTEGSREDAMRASLDLLIYKGANPYVYCGNTILYNGQTYYLWESQIVIDSQAQYFVTSSIDFNTLHELSLEDSLQNHFTSAIGIFDDLLTIYNPLSSEEQFLIKVERL